MATKQATGGRGDSWVPQLTISYQGEPGRTEQLSVLDLHNLVAIAEGNDGNLGFALNQRVGNVRLFEEPLGETTVAVGPSHHSFIVISTVIESTDHGDDQAVARPNSSAATFTLEKFDTGIVLGVVTNLHGYLKEGRKQSTAAFKVQELQEQQTQTQKSGKTLKDVLLWLLDTRQLEKGYDWQAANCQKFADEIVYLLTGCKRRWRWRTFSFVPDIIEGVRYRLSTWDQSVLSYWADSLFLRHFPPLSEARKERIMAWIYQGDDSSSTSTVSEVRLVGNINPLEAVTKLIPITLRSRSSNSTGTTTATAGTTNNSSWIGSDGMGTFVAFFGTTVLIGFSALAPAFFLNCSWTSWREVAINSLMGFGAYLIITTILVPFLKKLVQTFHAWRCRALDDEDPIDLSYDVPRNKVKITIAMEPGTRPLDRKTGTHALVLFQWTEQKKVEDGVKRKIQKFATAELTCRKATLSDYKKRKPRVKVVIVEGVDRAKPLLPLGEKLTQLYTASFERTFSSSQVVEKLESLKKEVFTYSSAGNHSWTQCNLRTNNQNCATAADFILRAFGVDIGLSEQTLFWVRTPRDLVDLARGHPERIMKPVVDPAVELLPGTLLISVTCTSPRQANFGGHALLHFQWVTIAKDGTKERKSKTAEFTVETGQENNNSSFSVSGKPTVNVSDTATGIKEGRALIKTAWPYFARLEYKYDHKLVNIETKIEGLKKYGDYTYFSSGNNPAGSSVNSRTNNQNCGTWIGVVLKAEFGIDLGIDSKGWQRWTRNLVLTPWDVVNMAANYRPVTRRAERKHNAVRRVPKFRTRSHSKLVAGRRRHGRRQRISALRRAGT